MWRYTQLTRRDDTQCWVQEKEARFKRKTGKNKWYLITSHKIKNKAGPFWNRLTSNHLVMNVTSVLINDYEFSYAVEDKKKKKTMRRHCNRFCHKLNWLLMNPFRCHNCAWTMCELLTSNWSCVIPTSWTPPKINIKFLLVLFFWSANCNQSNTFTMQTESGQISLQVWYRAGSWLQLHYPALDMVMSFWII